MDSDSISDLPNQDQKNTTEEDSSKLDIELDLQDQFK